MYPIISPPPQLSPLFTELLQPSTKLKRAFEDTMALPLIGGAGAQLLREPG